LSLHVQPGAKRTEVAGVHGDALKVRLAAPPVDGKANTCLLRFLAERLEVAAARLEIAAGASSRSKRIAVKDIDPGFVEQRLLDKTA